MNTPINFEIAKLLKEKWFDRETLESYEYRGVEHQQPSYKGRLTKNKLLCDILAPTIAEVVMWLYEKHGIWLKNDIISINQVIKFYSSYYEISNGFTALPVQLEGNFNSPTEAYEAGIEYTLKNLI